MLKIKQIGMLLVTMSAMLVLFAGCGDKDDGGDKESLATLVAETVSSSTTTNKISTQGPSGITFEATIVSQGGDAEWCSFDLNKQVSSAGGNVGDPAYLYLDKNNSDDDRTARIDVTYTNGYSTSLTLTQRAAGFIDYDRSWGEQPEYRSDDAYIYKIPAVIIVEIMGRDAGWLTASSALARTTYSQAPDLIYLPEVAFSKEQFLKDVKNKLTKQKTVIVAVSEGIHDADGNYISSDSAVADKFGHAQLSGAGKALEYLVRDEIGVKVRSIELNVLQRCAGHIASRTDITESFALGQAAVKYAAEGKTGIMVTINRISNDPYQWVIQSADVSKIANEAKSVPSEWIHPDGNDVTDEMIDYLRPLIIGEISLQYKDGLPVYLPVDHLLH